MLVRPDHGENPSLLRTLRYVLLAILLVGGVIALAAWWKVRQALPLLDGSASLAGLKQEVTVDRDAMGVPTIRAGSMEDLLMAQGYVLAQDRLWQMDVLRRAAAGELSEIFGPVTVELDKQSRLLGLRAAAEKSLEMMKPEYRGQLEAYAAGINRYIEQHRDKLPVEFLVLRYEPRPWTPADSLLIHGYMYNVLTSTWEWELQRAKVTEKVGAERAREMFPVDSPLDHFIVGGEAPTKAATKKRAQRLEQKQIEHPQEVQAARDILHHFREDAELVAGSNNWAVSGVHTYSGKPILANDTHLPNDVPCIWYMMHLKAPGYNVKGFALPGGPLIVIGHNERIAWGFTNNGADVQDLYIEKFNNRNEYLVNGKWTPAEVRTEIIKIKGQKAGPFEVTVTRHGPIVQREGNIGYALKWTATEPGGLGAGQSVVGRAQNWDEFREAMRQVSGPAQNGVYADVDGNIGFIVAAKVPIRKNGDGSVPMPGDTDDYEWTGYIPFEELPQVLNPPGGVIATANARVVGPGYKPFLTNRWYMPYRTNHIYELLAEHKQLRPEDCIPIQADIYSPPHVFLARQLAEASKTAKPTDARAGELLSQLDKWDGRAEARSRVMAFVEFTRRELFRDLVRPVFGKDAASYTWSRSAQFFENVLRERPAHWLPKEYATYDAWLMAAADRAVKRLEQETRAMGGKDPEKPESWEWGRFVPLQMLHPLGRSGLLKRYLSISGLPQNGSGSSVKQTGRSFGPAMRFVADMADLDKSLMNITLGQSGQYFSQHYRDQFDFWFEGRGVPSAFSDAAEEKTRVHRLKLMPGS